MADDTQDKQTAGPTDTPADIDFLPAWYPKLLRRRRLLRAEMAVAYTAVIIVSAIALNAFLDARTASIAFAEQLTHLEQSRLDVRRHRETLGQLKDLQSDGKVARQIGLPVEVTRVLATLDRSMPPQVSLREVRMRVDERTLRQDELLTLLGNVKTIRELGDKGLIPKRRTLHVTLQAVGPDGSLLAAFAAALERNAALQRVRLTGGSDITVDDHLARNFGIEFEVRLNHVDRLDAVLTEKANQPR